LFTALLCGAVFASPLVQRMQGEPLNREALLLRAARSGDSNEAAELLRDGAAVNARDEHDLATPLMLAVDAGNVDLCRQLLAAGADVNAIALRGDSALTRALRHPGRPAPYDDIMQLLLANGADANRHGDLEVPPLSVAALYGRTRATRMLLDAGADVNLRGGLWRAAPLQYAVASADAPAELVELLLRSGADVNAFDSEGRTALTDVAAWGRTDLVKMLLDAGADARKADCEETRGRCAQLPSPLPSP
jgi:ankyrin repeat protein